MDDPTTDRPDNAKIWLHAFINRSSEIAEAYLQQTGLEYIRWPEESKTSQPAGSDECDPDEPYLSFGNNRPDVKGLQAIEQFCQSQIAA